MQLLRANGCTVIGVDTDAGRLALARQFGAETVDLAKGEDPLARANAVSRGRGVDGVLLTLSSKSNEPVTQAAKMCRKRGRIVLVGVTGLKLSRADFYEKELSFQVSCSYGPGRYDPEYEDKGQDYPLGFVRWTEQRNFEAVLDMMAAGALNVRPLITHSFPVEDAAKAYDVLASGQPSMGILIAYPDSAGGRKRPPPLRCHGGEDRLRRQGVDGLYRRGQLQRPGADQGFCRRRREACTPSSRPTASPPSTMAASRVSRSAATDADAVIGAAEDRHRLYRHPPRQPRRIRPRRIAGAAEQRLRSKSPSA